MPFNTIIIIINKKYMILFFLSRISINYINKTTKLLDNPI